MELFRQFYNAPSRYIVMIVGSFVPRVDLREKLQTYRHFYLFIVSSSTPFYIWNLLSVLFLYLKVQEGLKE